MAIAEALDRTITALESGDMVGLWEITAPAAKTEITKLHKDLHEALALVDTVYPESQRAAARQALGQAVVGSIPLNAADAGPQILGKILDPKAVRLDEKARDGLRSRGATIDDDKALLHTSAEERFTFEKTDDGWRSGLVMDLIEQNRRFDTLRENARKVLEARDEQREAWRASKDAKVPQGGFNLMREALGKKPLQYKRIFALLDAKSRAVPLEALNKSREIQKILQRRSKKSKRKALYKKHHIDKYVRLETDRGVFSWWLGREDFVIPLAALGERPERIEGKEDSGAVTIVTDKGSKHLMRRGPKGIWRLASYEGVLRAKLMVPLEAELKTLKPASK